MTFANDFAGAIGIDLGTTYSCVAAMTADGRVEIIANEQGNRTTPSYVAFMSGSERLVGDSAKNQAAMNPANTVFDIKRLIGRNFDDQSVQSDMMLWPFKVVDVDGAPYIKIDSLEGKNVFSPQAISAMVLTKMKDIAEMKLGENVKKAVITVPAYFGDSQRQATKDAGIIAGLEVLRIINEPTAAAIAYGLDQRQKDIASGVAANKERIVLIFDLGGGTFDVSLLKIADGVFNVLATAGDTHLGGEDFDNTLVKFFVEDFKKRHGVQNDIYKDARALRRLRSACERAKRSLSTLTKATIEIDSLFQSIDYTSTITRAKFEELNLAAFDSTLEPVRRVLSESKIDKSLVDDVVLVGGSTRIPKIQSLLAGLFECSVEKLNKSINPDEAVAHGAAVQAAILTGTAGATNSDVLLVDVVPLNLGVETENAIMEVVIPCNTTIPTIKRKFFTTVKDNQDQVLFPIYEGLRCSTKDNRQLGEFTLSGIPLAPRGVPQIEAIFDIDANGILTVTAIESTTKRSAKVTINHQPGKLRPEEIEKLVQDAKLNSEADKEKIAKIEARQSLQECVYRAESQLRDISVAARLKCTDDLVSELAETMEWLDIDSESATQIDLEARQRRLERTISKTFAAVYAHAQGAQQQQQRRGNRNRRT